MTVAQSGAAEQQTPYVQYIVVEVPAFISPDPAGFYYGGIGGSNEGSLCPAKIIDSLAELDTNSKQARG